MPGANLPELTREITSIPRDASEYPRRPIDRPSDDRSEIKVAGFILKDGGSPPGLGKCRYVIFNVHGRSSLRKRVKCICNF